MPSCLRASPLGYIIAKDRYLKRDELGVIYQLCVAPGDQRKLIGASLIKAVFERAAYGCRLFCCWCAQDLAANYFWESLGFVPIAFRAGSTGKKRVHIFWQKRIDEGRVSGIGCRVSGEDEATADALTRNPNPETRAPTPYWYPFKTDQGAMREDRIVFPIPPGTHWSEVKAVAPPRAESPKLEAPGMQTTPKPKRKVQHAASPAAKPRTLALGGFRFETEQPATQAKPRATRAQGGPRAKDRSEPSRKIDPTFLAAARELRDRYLERVNAEPTALPAPVGRYDVTRALPATGAGAPVMHIEAQPLRQLPSAA